MLSKTCTACNTKFYSLSSDGFVKYFHKQSARIDGFTSHCKKCISKYKKAYHLINPQKRERKILLDKNCIVCNKPFQTKIERVQACCKECSYIRKK